MSGFDRRGVLRLVGAVGVSGLAGGATAGALAGCGTTGEPDQLDQLHDSQVRVGLLVPEAGGYQAIGAHIVHGCHQFAAAHGDRIGGHPYAPVQADEGDTPEEAVAGAERLLDQAVHAIIGVTRAGAMLAVSALAEERGVPLLGAHASPHDLPDSPYLWRTSYLGQEPGLALGSYLATAVSGPVELLAEDSPTGADAIAGLQEAFQQAQSGELLAEPVRTPENPGPADDFFTRSLAEVAQRQPEAVFAGYEGAAAIAFVRQYLAAGLDPARLYGLAGLTEGAVLTELTAELGDAAAGIRTVGTYAPELRVGENRSFSVDYQAAHGQPPSSYAVAGYDAAFALDKAVRLTGGRPSRETVAEMLDEVGLIDSPRGQWQFNQTRTPTQKWYLRELVADGPVLANVLVSELGTLG